MSLISILLSDDYSHIVWLFLGAAACFVGVFFLDKVIKKAEDGLKKYIDELEDFTADEIHLSKIEGFSHAALSGKLVSAIAVDKNKKKICFVFEGSISSKGKPNTAKIYSFNDIMQSEIVVDGNTLVKTSTTSTVGRAILGGILSGGVGAVIGGVTGKKSHNEVVNNIDLKICVNDSVNPFYKVRFLDLECKKGDVIYDDSYEKVETWHAMISIFIKEAEVKEDVLKSESSNADELLKLKELLDSGLITKQEFNDQKKKILK
jgi:hypothetical protein